MASVGDERHRQWTFLPLIFILGFAVNSIQCLREVRLHVEPTPVPRGQPASLLCNYDLEGAPLYSVKWYRGQLEFYRYSPSETPVAKIFPFPGIDVDLSSSNSTQAVLRKVGLRLSGNFSCEVTADAPSFSTKTAAATMTVVSLPEGPPILQTDRERYLPGDLLRANCSSPPSRPAAELDFFINGQPVSGHGWRVLTADSLQSSVMSLSLRLLQSHFEAPGGSSLTLRCRARLEGLYEQQATLQLGPQVPADPVPQRVTSSHGMRVLPTVFHSLLVTALLVLLQWFCR